MGGLICQQDHVLYEHHAWLLGCLRSKVHSKTQTCCSHAQRASCMERLCNAALAGIPCHHQRAGRPSQDHLLLQRARRAGSASRMHSVQTRRLPCPLAQLPPSTTALILQGHFANHLGTCIKAPYRSNSKSAQCTNASKPIRSSRSPMRYSQIVLLSGKGSACSI